MGIAVLLFYMVLPGCGAMISPGVGFFGGLVVMLPQSVTELSHAPAYGLLTWLFTVGLLQRGWPQIYALPTGMSAAFVFGLFMEICQAFVPGRVVDSGDVFVNVVGIGMAALLMLWWAMPAEHPDKTGLVRPAA